MGVVGLYFGAEWLVRGAAGLAQKFGVRPLVIGLTVVAYGTSAPELVVSGLAALEGKSALAVGNVVGSNIANLGIILGVAALISPPAVEKGLIRLELPALLVATALIPFTLWDGVINRVEGGALLILAAGFTWITLKAAKKVPAGEFTQDVAEEVKHEAGEGSKLKLSLIAAGGLAVLMVGGKVFVDGAVGIALALGMSERLVGLTIVAVGTSLPELAASVVAAARGHSEIAIGNVLGSNIFNALLILGAAATLSPVTGELSTMRIDMIALFALTLFGSVLLLGPRRLRRIEGGLLVAGYAGFVLAIL